MADNAAAASFAMMSVTQCVTAFTAFIPAFSDIRKHTPQNNPSFAADVRMGEAAAVTVTLGIGAISSSIAQSPMPALTAIVMSAILVTMYEVVLRKDNPGQAANVMPVRNLATV